MPKKNWIEKRDEHSKPAQTKVVDKRFADITKGSTMFIATPKIIDDYIKRIPAGEKVELQKIREDLAQTYKADKTCPVTTAIFFRIVSEAAYEEYAQGKPIEKTTPFWRVSHSKAEAKYTFGRSFVLAQRTQEKIIV